MKRIVWASRHAPLEAQLQELRRIFGDFELVRVSRVSTAESFADYVCRIGARAVVAVLPLSVIARIVELLSDIPVLVPRMRTIAETSDIGTAMKLVNEAPDRRTYVVYDNVVRVFEFERFERVRRVVVETEPI